MDKDTVTSYATMFLYLYLMDKQRKEYEVKYHLVDNKWKLHNVHTRRTVRSKFDVFVNNDVSFRVRAITREKAPDNMFEDVNRHFSLSIPRTGDFFDTKVVPSRNAPFNLSSMFAVPKMKVVMKFKSLLFTVAYLDPSRNEFRLECRLPEQEHLGAHGNDRWVLLKKVRQLLRDGSK